MDMSEQAHEHVDRRINSMFWNPHEQLMFQCEKDKDSPSTLCLGFFFLFTLRSTITPTRKTAETLVATTMITVLFKLLFPPARAKAYYVYDHCSLRNTLEKSLKGHSERGNETHVKFTSHHSLITRGEVIWISGFCRLTKFCLIETINTWKISHYSPEFKVFGRIGCLFNS